MKKSWFLRTHFSRHIGLPCSLLVADDFMLRPRKTAGSTARPCAAAATDTRLVSTVHATHVNAPHHASMNAFVSQLAQFIVGGGTVLRHEKSLDSTGNSFESARVRLQRREGGSKCPFSSPSFWRGLHFDCCERLICSSFVVLIRACASV